MKEAIEDYTARARLFDGNRMKLGHGFNCSHGSTITTVPEAEDSEGHVCLKILLLLLTW
jgi:hypothetical protein